MTDAFFVETNTYTGGSLGASRKLHRRLLDRVLHAPMAWFDATPYGRIFNRFSTDFQTVDKEVREASLTDMLPCCNQPPTTQRNTTQRR